MRILFIFLLATSFVLAEEAITAEFIEQVKASGATWESTSYEENVFRGWTIDEIKKMLGTTKDFDIPIPPETDDSPDPLPTNFDWREKNKRCIHPIRDQSHCGSCWAFAATEALSDRFCIKGLDVILSPQDLVSCDPVDRGCQGGGDITPYTYMTYKGVVSDSCFPYFSGNGSRHFCPNKCVREGEAFTKYRCSGGAIVKGLKNTQKRELMENGPVSTAFMVYKDFMTYKAGVYYYISGELLGGHAVKVIGWGVENGIEYWLCVNSWGSVWGDRGFFKIKMDDCQIMERGVSCEPDIK